MGAGKPKQFIVTEDGRSIIRRSVDAFRNDPEGVSDSEDVGDSEDVIAPEGVGDSDGVPFDIIVVTAPEDFLEETDRLVNDGVPNDEKAFVIPGGKERQDSVQNGLGFLRAHGMSDDDIVLIHDGARPFVTQKIISGDMDAAAEHEAAIAAVPVKETIRDISKGTLDRSGLYAVQTPQGFRFGLIERAVESAAADGFYGTDDGGLVERAGVMPVIVPGSYDNIKITTPADLGILKAGN